jgi:hypothetical protein
MAMILMNLWGNTKMKMSDSEKIALIDEMIGDFWEYNTAEQRKAGAEAFISVIATVINFGKGDE